MEKSSLLSKITDMRNEIISLKECRPPPTERDTKDNHKNKSDSTGRNESGRRGNGQQSANQCHHPHEQDFGRKRNLPTYCKTEICHPTCKQPSSGTKGIISSNCTFMDIPQNRTCVCGKKKRSVILLGNVHRYFKKFPHFFVCRVLVSVRLLKLGSTVHHILIV